MSNLQVSPIVREMQKKMKFKLMIELFLTEHSFTDRSALYRIPLELVKNRKLHNEKVFF